MTYWMSKENYGQILQMFALSMFLKNLGHDVFIVQYDGYSDSTITKSFINKLLGIIKNPQKIIRYIKAKKREKVIQEDLNAHDCGFDSFREKFFNWSKKYLSYNDLVSNPPKADAFICGSDMIWAETSKSAPYFLNFVKNVKKIAYAPSFGTVTVSDKYLDEISLYLSDFVLITTREESGVKICKQIGFDAYWVIDPTGLLNISDYIKIEEKFEIKNKYVFMYLLGHDTYVPFSDIKKFADANNFSVVYRASPGRRDKLPKFYPTIGQWVYAVHHAEYVITNSFHGCMFCILFRKKFLYLPLINVSKPNNERIYSLLNRLNLSNRIYKGNFNIIYEDINYNQVNTELLWWIEQSKQVLLASLN